MTAVPTFDPFGARRTLATASGNVAFHSLAALSTHGLAPALDRLPYSLRVLLENVLRHGDGAGEKTSVVERLARWNPGSPSDDEVPFRPSRVLLQDFTGVPVLVGLAAMRAAALPVFSRSSA